RSNAADDVFPDPRALDRSLNRWVEISSSPARTRARRRRKARSECGSYWPPASGLVRLVVWESARKGRGCSRGRRRGALPRTVSLCLGFANVLGARTLGALAGIERHALPLAKRVERLAGRLMKEVLLARLVGHEAETLVCD